MSYKEKLIVSPPAKHRDHRTKSRTWPSRSANVAKASRSWLSSSRFAPMPSCSMARQWIGWPRCGPTRILPGKNQPANGRSSVYAAIQAVREDCADKWQAAKRFCEEITKDVINPLKEILQENTKKQKEIVGQWKASQRVLEDRKEEVAETNGTYFRAFEEFDRAMASHDKAKESGDNKLRLAKRISQVFVKCKKAETSYKTAFNAAKELLVDNLTAMVTTLRNESVGNLAGKLPEDRGGPSGMHARFSFPLLRQGARPVSGQGKGTEDAEGDSGRDIGGGRNQSEYRRTAE